MSAQREQYVDIDQPWLRITAGETPAVPVVLAKFTGKVLN
jgi:hypothetical protein